MFFFQGGSLKTITMATDLLWQKGSMEMDITLRLVDSKAVKVPELWRSQSPAVGQRISEKIWMRFVDLI